jgi:GNAT superfamily N-acetyltransferase
VEWSRGDYRITDDKTLVNLDFMTESLNTTYWAGNRSRERIAKSVQNSVVLFMYHGDRPIGFSRIVGDDATFAWICDVYIHPDYRGQGLGVWLMECTQQHPACDVGANLLATRDAFSLYEKFGYVLFDRAMVRRNPAPDR